MQFQTTIIHHSLPTKMDKVKKNLTLPRFGKEIDLRMLHIGGGSIKWSK